MLAGLRLNWPSEFLFVKIFLLYLSLVVVMSAIRVVAISKRLVSWENKGQVSVADIGAARVTCSTLVDLGLAGRLSGIVNLSSSTGFEIERQFQRAVRTAEELFSISWERLSQAVHSHSRLALLTFYISMTVSTYGIAGVLEGRFVRQNDLAVGLIREALAVISYRVSLGFAVCVVLLVTSNYLERLLNRRKATWDAMMLDLHKARPLTGGPR